MEANYQLRAGRATRKRKAIIVIHGCYRIRAKSWKDVIGMVRNGGGLIRDGKDFRLVYSEAFEQGVRS